MVGAQPRSNRSAIRCINDVLYVLNQLLAGQTDPCTGYPRPRVVARGETIADMKKSLELARRQLGEVLEYLDSNADALFKTGKDHIGFRLLKAKIQ